jgi:uncharacterized protein (TIGR03000 family)
MGEQRHLFRTCVLAVAGALLAPAATQAQFLIGVPFGTARPVFLPSAYYPLGYYSGGLGAYTPFGYGTYGSPYTAYPYAGYSYGTVPIYQSFAYQPLLPYTGATLSAGTLPYYSGTASSYPRMRDKFYPLVPSNGTQAAGLAPFTSAAGLSSGALLSSYAPVTYASTVCGALTYAPVAYDPAGYAAAAVAALSPPTRLRQANYPPDAGIRGAAYAGGAGTRRAQVVVQLPRADATVWFDDVPMKQTGKVRRFFTPRLDPQGRYTYHVRVRWSENGKTRQQERDIYLQAGDVLDVDFSRPQ